MCTVDVCTPFTLRPYQRTLLSEALLHRPSLSAVAAPPSTAGTEEKAAAACATPFLGNERKIDVQSYCDEPHLTQSDYVLYYIVSVTWNGGNRYMCWLIGFFNRLTLWK